VYATYLHGPVLPKNPWLADHLLSRALAHRYQDVDPLAPLTDQAEERASAAALRLARRPAGRWRAAAAAAAAASRFRRPAQTPAPTRAPTPAAAGANATTADKETPWTSH
jgi:hypothetical protein